MAIKIIMLVIFFGVMIGVGVYCRKQATDVNGFVLGGRNVGPWLTAFAYGTSYFSAVIFIGMLDSSDGSSVLLPHGSVLEMHLSVPCLHGMYLADGREQ